MAIFFNGNLSRGARGLFIPPITATGPYTITYLLVGGGGGGDDTQGVHGPIGGNGGAVVGGTLTLTPGVTYTLQAGAYGHAPTYGQAAGASSSASSNTELAQPTDGGLSKISVGSTILAQAAGGLAGCNNGGSAKSGGYGGNGTNSPYTSTDENGDTTFIGGNGVSSSIEGSLKYYGAGGGGGDPDVDFQQNGISTPPNYGLGGTSGNKGAGSSSATSGQYGVIILQIPSTRFGSTNGTATPDGFGNQLIITQSLNTYTA